MSVASKLPKLLEPIGAEARPQVARLLHQIAHDLNTPISTIAMEVYSARMLLDKLRASIPNGKTAETSECIAEIDSIYSNLEKAAAKLAEYGASLSRFADWEEPR